MTQYLPYLCFDPIINKEKYDPNDFKLDLWIVNKVYFFGTKSDY